MSSLRAVALLSLCATLPAVAAETAGPAAVSKGGAVAVMPFKNLGGSHELDWLKLGIAETLLADLAKDGGRTVVERDQIDRAMAEVMLQADSIGDDSIAAQAGKLVGAAVVVLGGFQQAGKELRITARFVDVETGVVKDTAKVTGALEDVFTLQDQIVAKLLNKAVTKPRPKKKSSPQKQVEAYQAYSLSLATSSDVERIRYLKESISSDPEFTYALDALAALEQRLNRYRKKADVVADQKLREVMALLSDESKPINERNMAVMQAFGSLTSSFRWRALLGFANAVYQMKPPKSDTYNVQEYASMYIVLCHQMLKEVDQALAAGERHLNEFPGSSTAGSIEMQMRNMIEDRRRLADSNAEAVKRLQEIDDDEAKLKPGTTAYELQMPMMDFRRCSVVYQSRLYADAVTRCRAWAERNKGHPQKLDLSARYFAALSLAELGRFAEARDAAVGLQKEDETWARSMGLPSILSTWPRD